MLNGKQKRYLRSLGTKERAIFQIGKEGLSINLFNAIDEALEARELVKVSLLKTTEVSVREAAIEMAAETHSEIAQIIGRTVLLYRPSREKKIVLP